MAGATASDGIHHIFALARYNADGTLDSGFGSDGKVNNSYAAGIAQSIAVQPDGKLVAAGYKTCFGEPYFTIVRYHPDGSLDSGFGYEGRVTNGTTGRYTSVKVQVDGKILAVGTSAGDFVLDRYNSDGTLDDDFGTGGQVTTSIGPFGDEASSLAVQANGKIIVAGSSYSGSQYLFALVRYNTDGTLDSEFGNGGKVTTAIGSSQDEGTSAVVQGDGKIIVAGHSLNGGDRDFALVRYNADGSLDTGFGSGGKVTTAISNSWDFGNSLALQSNSKIVLAGVGVAGETYDFAMARYNADGTLDSGFGNGGKVTSAIGSSADEGYGLVVQGDGKLIVAGASYNGSNYDFALARFEGNAPADSDADGMLDQWELNNWRTTTGHGALDDHDKDGYGELLEQAFGLNPLFPDPAGIPGVTQEGGYLTMTLTKQPGVSYAVQTAGSLLTGQPDSFSTTSTTVLINNATTLKVRDNVLMGSATTRFNRAQVTGAP